MGVDSSISSKGPNVKTNKRLLKCPCWDVRLCGGQQAELLVTAESDLQ